MKVLITGASGLLGRKALEIFGRENEVIGTERAASPGIKKMDIINEEEITSMLKKYLPDIVFNSAALVDVDLCEKDKIKAWEINVNSLLYLAESCKKNNIKLIAISSDYIFSGENSPYYENSIAHPKNFYGFTKMIMEQVVQNINPEAIIIRPSILYGLGEKDKLIYPVLDALKAGKEFIVNDYRKKYPVLIDDFLRNTLILIKHSGKGIYNFASANPLNRLEMARTVVRVFNLEEKLIVERPPKESQNKPYNVQLIDTKMTLEFVSFEEGVRIVKSQMEEIK